MTYIFFMYNLYVYLKSTSQFMQPLQNTFHPGRGDGAEASAGVGAAEGCQPDGKAENGQAGAGAGGGHTEETRPSAHGGSGQDPERNLLHSLLTFLKCWTHFVPVRGNKSKRNPTHMSISLFKIFDNGRMYLFHLMHTD